VIRHGAKVSKHHPALQRYSVRQLGLEEPAEKLGKKKKITVDMQRYKETQWGTLHKPPKLEESCQTVFVGVICDWGKHNRLPFRMLGSKVQSFVAQEFDCWRPSRPFCWFEKRSRVLARRCSAGGRFWQAQMTSQRSVSGDWAKKS
jgi:hypothetical protein